MHFYSILWWDWITNKLNYSFQNFKRLFSPFSFPRWTHLFNSSKHFRRFYYKIARNWKGKNLSIMSYIMKYVCRCLHNLILAFRQKTCTYYIHSDNSIISRRLIIDYVILLSKLFWPTERKKCSIVREKLLKLEAENLQNFWDH